VSRAPNRWTRRYDGNDKFGMRHSVAVAEHPVDLVTRQFQAASTHRLRFRHWMFPPSEVMDRPAQ
jgi:hypothetical protein